MSVVLAPDGPLAIAHLPKVVRTEAGEALPPLHVAYRREGPRGAPVVLVMGGISAGRHAADHAPSDTRGWWREIVRPHGPIDTQRLDVLTVDPVGGFGASSGPASQSPWPNPRLTTRDHARICRLWLDALEIHEPILVVGASFGGMVGLALAEEAPHVVAHLVAISAPDRPHPRSVGWRAVQRALVSWGVETGHPRRGLALARALAMTTYRGAEELEARFGSCVAPAEPAATSSIEAYLRARGDAFARRAEPTAYLALSEALDRHSVDPTRIRVPVTLVGTPSDALVPYASLERLADAVSGPVRLLELESPRGHDAFLTEPERLGALLRQVLAVPPSSSPLPRDPHAER